MMPITERSIAIDGEIFADRRAEGRRRVLKGARLEFNQGYGAMECVLRNQSDRGARLVLGDTMGVPARFDLVIAGEEGVRTARVRWRTGEAVGIDFE
ncbi:hypothetical protein GRZ55_18995 [Chelativorans sp. ZYF759]|uniref:PilZ domain-containing protein n=1 Tax=Chelativorans sp. ZYF759 TaxID=2692213 RepID=UPI00145E8893|nr:PilZ domain-containing protein [Chelativorans sp. ZYF759]NMG41336.1 hypothetical protein [Chelativorans sp. ZYF759]